MSGVDITASDNRIAAARAVAVGICRASGCGCAAGGRSSNDERCIAQRVWGDLAMAGVVRAEAEGWFILPPT